MKDNYFTQENDGNKPDGMYTRILIITFLIIFLFWIFLLRITDGNHSSSVMKGLFALLTIAVIILFVIFFIDFAKSAIEIAYDIICQ